MLNLTKDSKNSIQNNQKQLQKAILTKNSIDNQIIVIINQRELNQINTTSHICFLDYENNHKGITFLKATLKKMLKFNNFAFKHFSKQEIIDLIDYPISCFLEN